MGVTPQYVGRYGKPWTITLNTDSGPDNIATVLSVSITLRNVGVSPHVDTASTGQITILSPTMILWQPTSTDYANAGEFELIPTATLPTGPIDYDPIPFTILVR